MSFLLSPFAHLGVNSNPLNWKEKFSFVHAKSHLLQAKEEACGPAGACELIINDWLLANPKRVQQTHEHTRESNLLQL
jgi:hypothetical protein